MPIPETQLSKAERDKILALDENHFCDMKSTAIAPGKLTRTIAALSNAEGGEVFIGIGQDRLRTNFWAGFATPEDANGHLQAFEGLFPLREGYSYSFLRSSFDSGLVLKVDVGKSRAVVLASDGRAYVRRGAQNLPCDSDDDLARLRRNKGLVSFETEPVNADRQLITNSTGLWSSCYRLCRLPNLKFGCASSRS
jgi:ATP-dependent DNA helicase RecG